MNTTDFALRIMIVMKNVMNELFLNNFEATVGTKSRHPGRSLVRLKMRSDFDRTICANNFLPRFVHQQ
jgi:hypothetical protein